MLVVLVVDVLGEHEATSFVATQMIKHRVMHHTEDCMLNAPTTPSFA